MRARIGDRLVVGVGRIGEVVGVPSAEGSPPYIIKWLKDGHIAMAGDGQVTMEAMVVKHTARKIRRMYQNRVLAGFAGSVADELWYTSEHRVEVDQRAGAKAGPRRRRGWIEERPDSRSGGQGAAVRRARSESVAETAGARRGG